MSNDTPHSTTCHWHIENAYSKPESVAGNASSAQEFRIDASPAETAEVAVTANGDGTYVLGFRASTAAQYFLSVWFRGAFVRRLCIDVQAGAVSPADSVVIADAGRKLTGEAEWVIGAGRQSNVEVRWFDAFGNAANRTAFLTGWLQSAETVVPGLPDQTWGR